MRKPEIIQKTATISFANDYELGVINLPLSVNLFKQDQDNLGVSQVRVLLKALRRYRARTEEIGDTNSEKDIILTTIWEIGVTLMQLVMDRLSRTCALLHDIKYDLDIATRYELLV